MEGAVVDLAGNDHGVQGAAFRLGALAETGANFVNRNLGDLGSSRGSAEIVLHKGTRFTLEYSGQRSFDSLVRKLRLAGISSKRKKKKKQLAIMPRQSDKYNTTKNGGIMMTENDKKLATLFGELVPHIGKADSLAGEITRAAGRIGYRSWHPPFLRLSLL